LVAVVALRLLLAVEALVLPHQADREGVEVITHLLAHQGQQDKGLLEAQVLQDHQTLAAEVGAEQAELARMEQAQRLEMGEVVRQVLFLVLLSHTQVAVAVEHITLVLPDLGAQVAAVQVELQAVGLATQVLLTQAAVAVAHPVQVQQLLVVAQVGQAS
jgi:hypothetical protein